MSTSTINSKCRTCKKSTNHNILALHEDNGSDDLFGYDYWNSYQVVKCLGCDTIGFKSTHANSDTFDPDTGELEETVYTYPDTSEKRQPIAGVEYFPAETMRVYRETLAAIGHGLPLLTAIGLRSIVESICLNLKTGTRTLKEGIDELASLGHLSQTQADFLHRHRFMGNTAAHEIRPPKPEQLVPALDIAETLLKTIYVLPHLASHLDAPNS